MASQQGQKIRVCLRSYEHKLVDVSAEKIVEAAKRTDAKVAGPIPLPTKRRIYCVLRSPHVDKKSREHFEIRTHKRIIKSTPSFAMPRWNWKSISLQRKKSLPISSRFWTRSPVHRGRPSWTRSAPSCRPQAMAQE